MNPEEPSLVFENFLELCQCKTSLKFLDKNIQVLTDRMVFIIIYITFKQCLKSILSSYKKIVLSLFGLGILSKIERTWGKATKTEI